MFKISPHFVVTNGTEGKMGLLKRNVVCALSQNILVPFPIRTRPTYIQEDVLPKSTGVGHCLMRSGTTSQHTRYR